MKFEELIYERPDYEVVQTEIYEIGKEIKEAADFEGVSEGITDYEHLYKKLMGMSTVAFIRCYQDSTNIFYAKEMAYCEAKNAMLDYTPIYKALLQSHFRNEVDEQYGKTFLRIIENRNKISSDGIELRGQEATLMASYQKLKATITFEYEGKTLKEVEILPLLKDKDSKIREAAMKSYGLGYKAHQEAFKQLLDELVQVRVAMARANGFDNFLDYMNIEKGRYSYGEKELTAFCDLVKEQLVPLCAKLHEHLREKLGLEKYTVMDKGIYFIEGNPKPAGDSQFLLAQAQKMYTSLDAEMGQLLSEMLADNYVGCGTSKNKISGIGFAAIVYGPDMPFIFGNSNGEKDDVMVWTHEFGHAFQMAQSMKAHKLTAYHDMPNDMAEIPSKVMEQKTYDYADLFFKGQGKQYVIAHRMGVLEEICRYTQIHEFETYLYTNPEATMEERVDKYIKIYKEYYPAVDMTAVEEENVQDAFLYASMGIYMFPRYLVSYALSDMCAVYFRILFDQDEEKGLALYKQLCTLGGSLDYNEAMQKLGIPLAYERKTVEAVKQYLEDRIKL